MFKVYKEDGFLPIKSWCQEPEEGALEQAKNLSKLPFAFKHIALMPDTHQGYGMPIGGVLASVGAVIPNAVGVDIGCGMCAIQTPWENIDTDTLKKIMGKIREVIPVGFESHKYAQDVDFMPPFLKDAFDYYVINLQWEKALKSLGTLGGGNHFIEFQKGSDGYIWIMVHSGSRNLGKQVADHYNKRAKLLNKWWYSNVPTDWDLAFLPVEADQDFKSYMAEMNYCVEYALANRKLMMQRIADIVSSTIKHKIIDLYNIINIAHNYARYENHYGENVIIHRKGATSARVGEIGLIPGSQGTTSYVVEGKGNRESFESCSHGAGRKMGRKEAERTLSLEAEIKKLDDQGIIHGIRHTSDLDEAAGAYKDIDIVMKEQEDLVDVVVELKPIAVIKG